MWDGEERTRSDHHHVIHTKISLVQQHVVGVKQAQMPRPHGVGGVYGEGMLAPAGNEGSRLIPQMPSFPYPIAMFM